MKKKVTIIGVGLIGSSIARALKNKSKDKYYTTGLSFSEESLNNVKKLNITDRVTNNLQEAVTGADIIILCTPVLTFANICKEMSPFLKIGAVISDAGSVKASVTLDVLNNLPKQYQSIFVPAHPIAGSDKTGANSGDRRLFVNKKVMLTPFQSTNKTAIHIIEELWKDCGATTEIITARRHDKIYAHVSHLPQLICFLLKPYLAENQDEEIQKTLRIANSDPKMWQDIFISNKSEVTNAATNLINSLVKNLNFKAEGTTKIDSLPENIMIAILAKSLSDITKEYEDYYGPGIKDLLRALNWNFKHVNHDTQIQVQNTLKAFNSNLVSTLDLLHKDQDEFFQRISS